jgi:hypothetical protein
MSSSPKIVRAEAWKQPDGRYKCPYCDDLYAPAGICSHIYQTHSKEIKNSLPRKKIYKTCEFCGSPIITNNFQRHQASCKENPANFCGTCKFCSKTIFRWKDFCNLTCSASYYNKIGQLGGSLRKRRNHGVHPATDTTTNYVWICFNKWPKQCAICLWDLCIHVHHIDGNHGNNHVSNLIPLCANHHGMAHLAEHRETFIILCRELVASKFDLDTRYALISAI